MHPNDHVNASQSSNDVMPTRAARGGARGDRARSAAGAAPRRGDVACARSGGLRRRREDRPHAPDGRDAGPPRAGDRRLGAPGRARAIERVQLAAEGLAELALGGTAVGTGINCPPGFAAAAIARVSRGHRPALRRGRRSLRGAGRARRGGRRQRGACRGVAVALLQDRERHSPARVGPALRARRAAAARRAAGLVDHAGQGQPGALRVGDPGGGAGGGQRRRRRARPA